MWLNADEAGQARLVKRRFQQLGVELQDQQVLTGKHPRQKASRERRHSQQGKAKFGSLENDKERPQAQVDRHRRRRTSSQTAVVALDDSSDSV